VVKEAYLYRRLEDGRVECTACARYCKIPPNLWGFCGVRWNVGGRLYLAVYGLISAIAVDPIEKKPLVHFYPGSMVLSVSTYGCNWACQFCLNFELSQRKNLAGFEVPPEMLVELALNYGAHGITYTYNEPTIFIEYAHDAGVIAKSKGLFNTFVSNGYLTPEAVDYLKDFLDAITVDLKGNADVKFLRRYSMVPDSEPIFQAVEELKRRGVHVEITDLVVPRVGDDLNMARKTVRRIIDLLGPDVPIHFLRFHPDYKMLDLPSTPVETLEKHAKVAKEEGARYVYIGNVPGHPLESTYCPECGSVVIKRRGFDILSVNLTDDNRCRQCGARIPIRGKVMPTWRISFRFEYVPIQAMTRFVKINEEDLRRGALPSRR